MNNKGFTLTETLIGLLIITVFAMGASRQLHQLIASTTNSDKLQASWICEKELEQALSSENQESIRKKVDYNGVSWSFCIATVNDSSYNTLVSVIRRGDTILNLRMYRYVKTE